MVTSRILPEAFAALIVTQPAEQLEEAAGQVGSTLLRDDVEMVLLKADWTPQSPDASQKPAKGKKYVSVLVQYRALLGGATYDISFWDATDKKGRRYEATALGPITPDLKAGDLAPGETVQGWVTFEVPRKVNDLTLIESQDQKVDLTWAVERKPRRRQ